MEDLEADGGQANFTSSRTTRPFRLIKTTKHANSAKKANGHFPCAPEPASNGSLLLPDDLSLDHAWELSQFFRMGKLARLEPFMISLTL